MPSCPCTSSKIISKMPYIGPLQYDNPPQALHSRTDNMRALCAGGLEFKSRPWKIVYRIANGLPLVQHLRKLAVLPWRYVAEMDTSNSLHISAYFGEYNERFGFGFLIFTHESHLCVGFSFTITFLCKFRSTENLAQYPVAVHQQAQTTVDTLPSTYIANAQQVQTESNQHLTVSVCKCNTLHWPIPNKKPIPINCYCMIMFEIVLPVFRTHKCLKLAFFSPSWKHISFESNTGPFFVFSGGICMR